MLSQNDFEGKYNKTTLYGLDQIVKNVNIAEETENINSLTDILINIARNVNIRQHQELYNDLTQYILKQIETIQKKRHNHKISDYFIQKKMVTNIDTAYIIAYSKIQRNIVKALLSKSDDYKRPWDAMKIIIIGAGWDFQEFKDLLLTSPKLTIMYWEHINEGQPHASIGETIRMIRTQKKLPQQLKGVTQPYLADMENGKRTVTYKKWKVICEQLGISEKDFVAELHKNTQILYQAGQKTVPELLKEGRERAGLTLEDLSNKTGYLLSTLQKFESITGNLTVCGLYQYVQHTDIIFEEIIAASKAQPKYEKIVRDCLLSGKNAKRSDYSKGLSTLAQYCVTAKTVRIGDMEISGYMAALLVQMIFFGYHQEDEKRLLQYLEMIQNGTTPEVYTYDENSESMYITDLKQMYRNAMIGNRNINLETRKKLQTIIRNIAKLKGKSMLVENVVWTAKQLQLPYYKHIEYNTKFISNNRRLSVDFKKYVYSGFTWYFEFGSLPYYVLWDLIDEAVTLKTEQQRQDYIVKLREIRKKHNLNPAE